MLRKTIVGVVCLAASLTVASATPIQYTFSFTGAGTLAGNNFTARTVTFGFSSDTTQVSSSSGLFETPNGTPGTYSLAGLSSGSITSNVFVYDNQNVPDAGFYVSGSADFFDNLTLAYGTYDLKSAIGPITTVTPAALNASGVATDGGQLIITSARDLSFTATVGSSTPEPASYSLIGLGMVGLAWFGRRFVPKP
jgi:PEP-CTERM motif